LEDQELLKKRFRNQREQIQQKVRKVQIATEEEHFVGEQLDRKKISMAEIY
jgi:hypothetical protein